MTEHARRDFLRLTAGATIAGAAAAAMATPLTAAHASAERRHGCPPPLGPAVVAPSDPRYADLVRRGNRRFVGQPDEVWVVGTTAQVVAAVREAVRSGRRVTVRSGGHCFEDFVDHPEVRVLIDLSGLDAVYFDPAMRAFAVEAGATLGEVYRRLYLGWGVTIPGGLCPTVGIGGHVAGGGYGALSRLHGLVVDHLYAVEVVVVDRAGQARAVVATREPDDPHRDLWWAHTGGGGGTFGVVTRYWFRSPGATGADPTGLLPRPPGSVLTFNVQWPWEGMTERDFSRLADNFGRWCERTAAPDSPYARVYSELYLYRRPAGGHTLIGQVAGEQDAQRLLDDHLAALTDGVGVTPAREVEMLPWLMSVQRRASEDDGKRWRLKAKAAYLRTGLTDQRLAAAYHHLTRADYDHPYGSVGLNSYGGRINTVPSRATAVAQRDSVIKLFYLVAWDDPADDARHLAWLREFYRDVYADSGGVPAPGEADDGSYIGYPDTDLADPRWNHSGVPWSALYFKENYRRLQQIKDRWDPRNVFRHALSVRPTR